MPVFRDPKKLQQHIKEALDGLQAETLITTQARLGSTAVSPVDTGRFRSSWFAAEGSPSNATAAEGSNAASKDATSLRVDSTKTYHLTNNLPYAESVAVEGNVVSKPTTWFKDFRSQTIPKIQQEAAKTIKRRFDL